MAASRHTRLADELPQPMEDRDPKRAVALCAEASRTALGDLSPGLILLPAVERRRVQTLAAYAITLYDFVRQTGLEGERLSQVNRWEFELDSALGEEPSGQPVFIALAEQQKVRPWNVDGFDRLHRCARRRIAIPRPRTPEALRAEATELATSLLETLMGEPSAAAIEILAAGLRAEGLRNLGDGARRHRPMLAASELPDSWATAPATSGDPSNDPMAEPVAREIERLREILRSAGAGLPSVPSPYRRCARFVRSACLDLLSAIELAGPALTSSPPRLGLGQRLKLLVKARILG